VKNRQHDILNCELIVVSGKGGVGKTTISAALGLLASAAAKHTIICEVAGQSRVPSLIGHPTAGGPGVEECVAPDLWTTTIDPELALVEWAGKLIRPRALLDLAVRSNSFAGFINAAPGGRELLTITKAAELSRDQRWDQEADGYELVILDAPASGHGLAMLKTPTTFSQIARVGPIANQARDVESLLADNQRCRIVLVSTLEETPVNETLELEAALAKQLGRGADLIIANGLITDSLSEQELEQLAACAGSIDATAITAIELRHARAAIQRQQLERLRAGAHCPLIILPAITSHAVGPDELEQIAALLDSELQLLA
jgi:anion-transporting  ArsA/GET3 family ATPase